MPLSWAALRWSDAPSAHPSRETCDETLGNALADARPDWVVCAGYLRILSDAFVDRFRGRLLNIHPSLLPRYRGLRTHARVLEAGDAGAVVAQATVPVVPGETPRQLATRVLAVEHPLLVATLRLAVTGRLAERNGDATLDGHPLFMPLRLDYAGTLVPGLPRPASDM